MEWILVLNFLTGNVTMPRSYPDEESCIGAGEKAMPQCNATIGLFDRVTEVCYPRRFICVPQPKAIRRSTPAKPRDIIIKPRDVIIERPKETK